MIVVPCWEAPFALPQSRSHYHLPSNNYHLGGHHAKDEHGAGEDEDGKPAFGYAVGSGSAIVTEVLAHCGIDFLLLDNQHGSIRGGWRDHVPHGGGGRHGHANDPPGAQRLHHDRPGVDEGALGVVVPMVENVADARAAADACRFPPHGKRSWGYGRAASYGDDYTDWIGEQLFVAVQIESAEAAGRAEEILATPGIDGCWIGPADLALSLGIHPSKARGDERHEQALAQVLAACRNTGKIPAWHARMRKMPRSAPNKASSSSRPAAIAASCARARRLA